MKTREKILKSAWRLFAKDGFEAVSVRDVTQDADVNLASINYHFGSKSGLIQEIVIEVLVPMNKQRVRLLKKAGDECGGVENVKLNALIEAYIRPVVCPEEYGGCSDMLARLMARYLIDRDYDVPMKVLDSFGDVYQIFGIAIRAQCPGLVPQKALEKLIFSTGAVFMFQSFSGLAAKASRNDAALDVDDYLKDAVAFCEAGFMAK
ncbi:MAG: TetR/AcrR family transcriptional regulator [Akkermansiaceae bacterium]